MKYPKNLEKDFTRLCKAFLSLKTTDECVAFLKDLCTPSEIKAMSERLSVCLLLDNKPGLSYRQIHEETKVSIATITRVARFFNQEENKGYRLVIPRLKDND
jgi:TrpR-related protein YerC/YecD